MDEPSNQRSFEQSVEPGVWRYAKATRLAVLVDAENYFHQIQHAMLKVREEIVLVGWDFDTRIHLERGRRWYQRPFTREYPSRLGSFLLWLARRNKRVRINLLVWGFSFLQFFTRGSMAIDMIRMAINRRIDFKHDTSLPIGCSHHQKIVVLDRSLAVCGGIDLTRERWDTRAHHPEEPRRVNPWGRHYQPWHDVTMMMEGEVAGNLFELVDHRWVTGGGEHLKIIDPPEDHCWPDELPAQMTNVEIGIARSRPAYKDVSKIDEVEQLFLAQIAAAKRFVYIESQYLTARTIVEAIATRLKEDDPPEFIIVHPVNADGLLEQIAMDGTRSSIAETLRHLDDNGRFHLYVPYTEDTPIYVHSKLMIVDDQILRIGSANLNNRSMGLDTECDVFVDAARDANHGCEEQIKALRYDLLAEHCGLRHERAHELFDAADSMAEVIAEHGQSASRSLRPFVVPERGEISEYIAGSQILDPEEPEDMFAAYPKGGLYRPGSILYRVRERLRKGTRG
jgi:phosphatidylserine/phosphatidylglycerophosphate/cardiolipin synthase-like enzyme